MIFAVMAIVQGKWPSFSQANLNGIFNLLKFLIFRVITATAAEMDDFRFAAERERCLLGYAKVPLGNLVFVDDEGDGMSRTRHVKQKDIDLLLGRFKADRCRRDEPRHWIDAVVTPEQLRLFLDHSSLAQLSDSEPVTLNLLPGWTITCLQGRVRVAAAMEWLQDEGERWWVVKFYDATRISIEAQRYMREYRDVSQELISGEIYRNVRLYQMNGDESKAREWIARWKPHNQRDFKQLQRRDRGDIYRPLREALDQLLPFPGLWSTYVNLHRLLPMRVPEEQANYLTLIWREWNRITGGRPEIVDAETVSHLEGRSPLWSQNDRADIMELFAAGIAFSSISDPEDRATLCQRVTQTPQIIPSLRTFHEDCKYLEPLSRLVRSLLSPKYRGGIQVGMKRSYQPPMDNNFYIQTTENGHRRQRHNPDYGFWSAYRQVFLAAMRYFYPLVPGFSPLKMHKVPSDMINMLAQSPRELHTCFTSVATSVGFSFSHPRQPQMESRVTLPGQWPRSLGPEETRSTRHPALHLAQNPHPSLTTDVEEEWSRCGMPDGTSFFLDKKYLYLDHIYSIPSAALQRRNLTSFAVKRDFFLAFFPPYSEQAVPTRPSSHPTYPDPGVNQPPPVHPEVGMGGVQQSQPTGQASSGAGNDTEVLIYARPQSQPAAQASTGARNDYEELADAPPLSEPAAQASNSAPNDYERLADAPSHSRPRANRTNKIRKRPPYANRVNKVTKTQNKWTQVLGRARRPDSGRRKSGALNPLSRNPRSPRRHRQSASVDNAGYPTGEHAESAAMALGAVSAQDGSMIVQQHARWCKVKINTAVGKFAGSIARSSRPASQYGCILYPRKSLALLILCSHADLFHKFIPECFHECIPAGQSGLWFASIQMPGGVLSTVSMSQVGVLLREGEVLVMGVTGTDGFDQQALHPSFDEIGSVDLPFFDGSEWRIDSEV